MGKGLSPWEEETLERLGCVLVAPVVLSIFRNGWEEGTHREGMRSLGYELSPALDESTGLSSLVL